MQLLDSPVTKEDPVIEPFAKEGNDLIFFCDLDSEGKLNCRWIKACLL